MSGLLETAAQAAAGIVERRVVPSSPLRRHETAVRIIVSEGFACGYVAALRAAQARLREEPRRAVQVLDEMLRMAKQDLA